MRQQTIASRESFVKLQKDLMCQLPENPACFGYKVYSQNEEDGIIQHCLEKISTIVPLDKTCIEFACGDGYENNTHLLLLNGYRAAWLDGDVQNISTIQKELGGKDFDNLKMYQDLITQENLGEVLDRVIADLGSNSIDLFSLDLDGNDVVFAEIIAQKVKPKLLVVEYNAKFPPPISISIDYNAHHIWKLDDYYGGSLQKFVDVLEGYTLVACSLSGINAFFVRNDCASCFPQSTPAELYQPARYGLCGYVVTHKPTLKWLKQIVRKS